MYVNVEWIPRVIAAGRRAQDPEFEQESSR
jgi:hypothetical protein